jgi:hypothetical protein
MMRKIVLVLIVLAFTMPALAVVDVNITPVAGKLMADIEFTVSGESELVRALALDITVDKGNIVDVNGFHVGECNGTDQGYGIFMGTIQIDGDGVVTDDGTPVAPQGDLPGDTLGGLGTSGVTLEMGSLYEDGNAPGTTVLICRIRVSEDCNMCVATNAGRAGIVLEDGKSSEDVSSPLDVNGPGIGSEPCTAIIAGAPTCWDATECVAQGQGDADCDGNIAATDITAFKKAIFTDFWASVHGTGPGQYNCCADFNHDGYVASADITNLKQGFALAVKTGLTPSTGNQNCPTTAP